MEFASHFRKPPGKHNPDSESRTEALAEGLVGAADPSPQTPADVPLWMRRVSIVVYVLFCLEVGLLLVILPWTRVWTENSLLAGYPQFQVILGQGFVRGLISGLGLVDIWLGVWEALHYREASPS
ncbi:MAG: hypothetical protein ACRD2R_00365 [Terriglobales bacterium]